MSGIYKPNPVTLRIEKMRMKWNEKITGPAIQLIRWLVQPKEAEMVEGFCNLEGTEFALLPDMFLVCKSNFTDPQSYEKALLQEWISGLEDTDTIQKIQEAGIELNWDHRPFKNMPEPDFFAALQSQLQSFEQFQGCMVIYLTPKYCYNAGLFKKWIEKKLENLPPRMRIMVHDSIGDELFDSLMTNGNRVNIIANLDLGGAVQELIKAEANTGQPQGKFTECLFMMGQAAEKNDMKLLDEWGEKALSCARKLKDPSKEIIAHLAWGGSLQAMKDLPKTLEHYNTAISFAEEILEKNRENHTVAILFLQLLTFKAGVFLGQKKLKETIKQYMLLAEQSKSYNQILTEMDAWYQVAELQKMSSNVPEMIEAYKKAFYSGLNLEAELMKSSRLPIVSKTLIDFVKDKDITLENTIRNKMTEIMGNDWYEKVTNTHMIDPKTITA